MTHAKDDIVPKTLTFKKILKDLALVIMIRSCNDMFS